MKSQIELQCFKSNHYISKCVQIAIAVSY